MNILIIGEYSSLSYNLKQGFKKLGHNVSIIQANDGFLNIPTDEDDIKYYVGNGITLFGVEIPHSYYLTNFVENIKLSYKLLRNKTKYEVVIVLHKNFLRSHWLHAGVSLSQIKRYKKTGSVIIMSACNRDPGVYRAYAAGILKYKEARYPDGIPAAWKKSMTLHNPTYDFILSNADMIIPMSPEYEIPIYQYCKDKGISVTMSKTVLAPINIEDWTFESCIDRKIKILHGVSRGLEKGSDYFIVAMKEIERRHPELVEISMVKGLSFNDYKKEVAKTDILLDQTNSYSIGMNAALGLVYGKVVFSGCEPELLEELGNINMPVINAKPDVDYLVESLEDLVTNPEKVDRIKRESRNFAVTQMSSEVIAKKYLKLVHLTN